MGGGRDGVLRKGNLLFLSTKLSTRSLEMVGSYLGANQQEKCQDQELFETKIEIESEQGGVI